MLRIYFLQNWLKLSTTEKGVYDMGSMRRFVAIDLGKGFLPNESTICKFNRFLDALGFRDRIFKKANGHLQKKRLRLVE